MKKLIKTTNGEFYLSLEEVMIAYENMLKQFANRCLMSFKQYSSNCNDFDDFVQLANMELISAFNAYDADKNSCFSTFLTKVLGNRFLYLQRSLLTQKRLNKKPLIYLNEQMEDGHEIGSLIEDKIAEEELVEEKEVDLEIFLKENLTQEELVYLTIDFQKKANKSKGDYKESVLFASDIFSDENRYKYIKNKKDLAKILKMSRPTLNKRIEEALDKLRSLTNEYLELIEI